MTFFYRLRGCNHTADWITVYFDLGLVGLKLELGHESQTDGQIDSPGPEP
jgi:hypothetical protein